jgi:hypothetical protein
MVVPRLFEATTRDKGNVSIRDPDGRLIAPEVLRSKLRQRNGLEAIRRMVGLKSKGSSRQAVF